MVKHDFRDLKPQNILLDDTNTLKVCDFGSATTLEELSNKEQDDSDQNYTIAYAANECFTGEKYDPSKADVFSMGVVLYEMVSLGQKNRQANAKILVIIRSYPELSPCFCVQIEGRSPFEHVSIIKGQYLPTVFATALEQDLLAKMLEMSASTRIEISALLNHPYVMHTNVGQHGQGDC